MGMILPDVHCQPICPQREWQYTVGDADVSPKIICGPGVRRRSPPIRPRLWPGLYLILAARGVGQGADQDRRSSFLWSRSGPPEAARANFLRMVPQYRARRSWRSTGLPRNDRRSSRPILEYLLSALAARGEDRRPAERS